MDSYVAFYSNDFSGIIRFMLIYYRGAYQLTLPDMMKTRYYNEDYSFNEVEETKLPTVGDIIEYDADILARGFFNPLLYLFFEYFILKYNTDSYDEMIDDLTDDVMRHIKFFFEMIRKRF